MRVLVTGGFGFIASELVRQLVDRGDEVHVVDNLTYASNPECLLDCEGKFEHYIADISDPNIKDVVKHVRPDILFHAAAESHVDRSLTAYKGFVDTNVLGTFNLLEGCSQAPTFPLFVYISTDEVYGSLDEGRAHEGFQHNPGNPYAVTKSASEAAVKAAGHTWGLPFIITRSCNNFGPSQHPEKLIPHAITSLLSGDPIKLHGNGANVREWVYVADNVRGILAAAGGVPGESYNITTGTGLTNREVIETIAAKLGTPCNFLNTEDRPGNDLRYAMTSAKLRLLGWRAEETFSSGLDKTISWYEKSRMWWRHKLTPPSTPSESQPSKS